MLWRHKKLKKITSFFRDKGGFVSVKQEKDVIFFKSKIRHLKYSRK